MENKSFTLIELIVVTSIIVLLTSLALPSYRGSNRQLTLQRAAYKLSQDLVRAQKMTMSAHFSDKTGGEVPAGGYGLRFQTAVPEKYLLFGDADSDHQYGISDYLIEEIEMEKGIIITSIEADTGAEDSLHVTFVPPDPEVFFSPAEEAVWTRISLAHELNLNEIKTIFINKVGLIAVE